VQPYLRFRFDQEEAITLYPLVCMHLGAPQCDYRFLTEHVERIRQDPTARWIYLGDGGECVLKSSKGSIYEQLLSPQAQLDAIVDLLEPIRGKGLFGIRGNHGHRIYQESGLSFDSALCTKLGVPFMGAALMAHLQVGKVSYSTYYHHGSQSGTSLRSKISSAENMARFVNADAIFTAHSHVAMELTPAPLLEVDSRNRKVKTKLRRQYICGCAYDSRTGYAEEKGYPPLTPSYISVRFDGTKPEQEYRRYASDLSYPLRHDYILDYVAGRDD
jgi:hypothetical protein